MSDLSHLRLENTAESLAYTYAGGGGNRDFRLPPRDRAPHAQKLIGEINTARSEIDTLRAAHPPEYEEIDGYSLTLRSDPGFDLRLESVERLREGVELLSVRKEENVTLATVFVRRDKLVGFLRLIQSYNSENTKYDKPKNQKLVESIASIQNVIVRDLWQDDSALFPRTGQAIWWEVWLRLGTETAQRVCDHFTELAQSLGIEVNQHHVAFPERAVLLARASADRLGQSADLLAYIAELRNAKELPTGYLNLRACDQRDFVAEAVSRLVIPGLDAPAVCLLDTGVNREHPLLAPVLAQADTQAVDPQWGSADHDPDQHGTGMAGIASYGNLTEVFISNGRLQQRHRLESIKLLPPPPGANAPAVYGWVTQQAVAKAEIQAPTHNRAICMAVTADDRDQGLPSSWSAAVDQMCAGELDGIPKLMFISAGNYDAVLNDPAYTYPDSNLRHAGIQDPAQAWNAITVGGYTDRVIIEAPDFQQGWQPIAPAGDLSPASRTSQAWPLENQKGWPIKPDIVMEGGNYITKGTQKDRCADHMLLTTAVRATGELLSTMADTSAATAGAARLAAILWSHYPSLRPETVRAILIHSARWTPAMAERFPDTTKTSIQKRLRCYGYGVPNLRRAIYSAENAATLIYEGELQPFHRDVGVKTNEMHLHQIPWPTEVLQQLGEARVAMHITLSYFINPSPGRKGWGNKHRFQSHGLRFAVIHPVETVDEFKRRVSRAMWDEQEGRPDNVQDDRNWTIGSKGRTHGSIHSDWWNGTASELARCYRIAVYPVTGWWRERPHLNQFNRMARYSLVISIETPDTQVDLYTPIANQALVTTELVE
ncbi:MAG: S8 family peptidase [Phycisphaerales bacterium]|nr:S8 family peptidase [Phycisphaerales bacterium]